MTPITRFATVAASALLLGLSGGWVASAAAQDGQIEREELPPLLMEPGPEGELPPPIEDETPGGFEGSPEGQLPPPEMEQGPSGEATPSIEEIQPAPEKKETRVKNPVAEFAGLDKITGRIISFDIYINETVQFGALQVTPKVCYSRPDAEEPKTDTFVEVDEITLDRKIRRIFTGWMFAESPGISAVEHPIYDVWLKSCKQKSDVPPPETAKTN